MEPIVKDAADGRLLLADRLFELLVDIHDEGERSLAEARFYAMRSFLPERATAAAALERFGDWLRQARERGWLDSAGGDWSAVEAWLGQAGRRPLAEDLGAGPGLRTTAAWHELQAA